MRKLSRKEGLAVAITLILGFMAFGFTGTFFSLFNTAFTAPENNAAVSVLESNEDASPPWVAGENLGDLFVFDFQEGEGETLEVGETGVFHYIGMLSDGTVFDSSFGGDPITVRIGEARVIEGWEKGVVGMKEGGRRRLVIPAEMGYGEAGFGPIPPNATLIFDIELVDVE